jgi:DNA-binding SARP family transcriptional activator/streptogramin lyase
VEFRILGPLELQDGPDPVAIDAPKQRALLGVLLLHPNEVVSTERLIDELWGERPPATAGKVVQTYVAQLRRVLGRTSIETRPPGYLLRIEEGALDAARFRTLATEARRLANIGQDEHARKLYGEALALWRGPALADVRFESYARNELDRFEEERLGVVIDRIDCDLALGRDNELLPELDALVEQHPLNERLRAQLMLALYRSGRQGDGLAAYQDARHVLAEQLALEPGEPLRQLERQILNHDPALRWVPPTSVAKARVGRRQRVWATAAVGAVSVASLALAVGLSAIGGSREAPTIVPNSLVRIDPRSNEVTDVIPVGRFPGKVASGYGFVWVVNIGDETISRVELRSRRADLVGSLRIKQPTGLTADGGRGVHVGSFEESEVVRVDPENLEVLERIRVPGMTASFLAAGAGSLWITQPPPGFTAAVRSSISRISLLNGRIQRRFSSPVDVLPGQIAFGAGAAWIANVGDGTVWRIDAATNRIKRIRVGSQPTDIAVGLGSVWVPCLGGNAVWRIDAATGRVKAVIRTGKESLAVATGERWVWVTNQAAGTVSRIDPETNRIVETIRLAYNPHGLVVAGGAVWVAVAQGLI